MFLPGSRRIINASTSVSSIARRHYFVENKITSLGLKLPSPAVPKGSFVNFVVVDNLAFLSGHLPQVMVTPIRNNLSRITILDYISLTLIAILAASGRPTVDW